VGQIGIDRQEFLYGLALWEIRSIIRGYRKRERTAWETARWQTFLILTAMGSKVSQPTDLAEFPWDARHRRQQTEEDMRQAERLKAEIEEFNRQQREKKAAEAAAENEQKI